MNRKHFFILQLYMIGKKILYEILYIYQHVINMNRGTKIQIIYSFSIKIYKSTILLLFILNYF